VVILGGGFGGLHAALRLRGAEVEVTVVDRRNFHLFQPLLYQVATGGLSPGDISSPIRHILRAQSNARVLLAEVTDVDVEAREVRIADGDAVPYDSLIVATGSHHHYFGNEGWADLAPGLKSIEDATEMRRRILIAFERAEREPDPVARSALLTFVIVGGGPTGVELAGAICELSRDTLRHDFRSIDPADARVLLIEADDRLLPPYPPELSEKARRSLEKLGAEVRLDTRVKEIDDGGVTLEQAGQPERVSCQCVLWAAGVRASPLARALAKGAGAELDRAGRLVVASDCSLPGYPEIFVVGDIAHYEHPDGELLPGVAPVAIQQGRYVADSIRARLAGQEPPRFRYRDHGSLATIGRKSAVADLGRVRFSGFPAWLLWSAIHIFSLVGFENRALVSLQWIWNYVTRNRGTRLITRTSETV
jgi:NADH dehydrogenase